MRNNKANRRVFTVTELNKYVKGIFESDILLNSILLQGEVSNFKENNSGHIYFSLKDEESAINVIFFKYKAKNIPFKIENGMKVILMGSVTLYEYTGSYQLIGENAEPVGKGAFQLAFEQLKQKLFEEGYFDEKYKKVTPSYPKTIGVVTSSTGAVIHDFINIVNRRNNTVKIVLAPSKVQGLGASRTICSAIENLNKYGVDLIIVARGGGSIEDLWAYNEESTVKAIFNSKTPIVSAVGHETDYTLSDFVADLRASTPSEAAELSVPNLYELFEDTKNKFNSLNNIIENKINNERTNLLKSYEYIEKFEQQEVSKVIDVFNELNSIISKKLDFEKSKQLNQIDKLNLSNPLNILSKGFSIVEINNKRLLSVKDVNNNDKIKIILKDGELDAEVLKVRKNNG